MVLGIQLRVDFSTTMGSAAGKGMVAAVKASPVSEVKDILKSMGADDLAKVKQGIAELSADTSGTYTLVYHGGMKKFLGRGWAPMLLLEEAKAEKGIKFECKAPDEVTVPITFAPPMVITPSGAQISQCAIIMTQLGKEFGFWPAEYAKDAKAMQLCVDAADMLSDVFGGKPSDRIEKWYGHFNKALEDYGGPFLMGDKITSVDFIAFQSCFIATSKSPDAKTPDKLKAWIDKVKDTKGFKAVEATKLPLMP